MYIVLFTCNVVYVFSHIVTADKFLFFEDITYWKYKDFSLFRRKKKRTREYNEKKKINEK